MEFKYVEYGTHCEYCKAITGLDKHHLIRRSQGGIKKGIIYLCRPCHNRATDSKKFELALQKIFKDRLEDGAERTDQKASK